MPPGLEFTLDLRVNISTPFEVGWAGNGLRRAVPISGGESVPAHEYYFRTTPLFHPPIGKFDWLRRSVFVGVAERYADLVIVHVGRVI